MPQLMAPRLRETVSGVTRAERWRRRSEDLHICNRDTDSSHDIEVEIRDGDSIVHRASYRLLPDQAGSSVNLLSAGRYQVTATVDGVARDTAGIRVSDSPKQTIYIEIREESVSVGNGPPVD